MTISLDVRHIRWRTQRNGHCNVDAVMALNCPGCKSRHQFYCPLDAPLTYLRNSRRCRSCRSPFELLDNVIDYTEQQGNAILAISAVLRCPMCSLVEVAADQGMIPTALDLESRSRLDVLLSEESITLGGSTLQNWPRPRPATRRTFISYRRNGGAAVARLLRQELMTNGWYAFLDVEDLGATRFDYQVLQEIERAEAIIVVLSPGALDHCRDPEDWVRREIAYALSLKKRLVPIYLEQFVYPKDLPEELAVLPSINYVPYSHQFFRATVDRLIAFLVE